MNNLIIETIKKHEGPGDFTHAMVTDEMIKTAENILNVKLPEQYIAFLQTLGHGGLL